MSELWLERDGARLHGTGSGAGRTVLFQHGLGGAEAQVAEIFPTIDGVRRLTLECRGHGESGPGPEAALSIRGFADDVLALADSQGATRFVAGGVSMGAAIALRLAVLHPSRVEALILVRPAWTFFDAPPNMAPFAEVACLLRSHPPDQAREIFATSQTGVVLRRDAPDNLASLLGFFDRRPVAPLVALLERLALDGPGVSEAQVRALALPTLVIGNDRDFVHPLAAARYLADTIPGAVLIEVAAKATGRARHAAEMRAAIAAFLQRNEARTP